MRGFTAGKLPGTCGDAPSNAILLCMIGTDAPRVRKEGILRLSVLGNGSFNRKAFPSGRKPVSVVRRLLVRPSAGGPPSWRSPHRPPPAPLLRRSGGARPKNMCEPLSLRLASLARPRQAGPDRASAAVAGSGYRRRTGRGSPGWLSFVSRVAIFSAAWSSAGLARRPRRNAAGPGVRSIRIGRRESIAAFGFGDDPSRGSGGIGARPAVRRHGASADGRENGERSSFAIFFLLRPTVFAFRHGSRAAGRPLREQRFGEVANEQRRDGGDLGRDRAGRCAGGRVRLKPRVSNRWAAAWRSSTLVPDRSPASSTGPPARRSRSLPR